MNSKATHSANATFRFTEDITIDKIYEVFPKQIEYLIVLELDFQTYITPEAISALIGSFPLTLSKIKLGLNTSSSDVKMWENLTAVLEKMEHLKSLSLNVYDNNLTDEVILKNIAPIIEQNSLSELEIQFIGNHISGECLTELAKVINHHENVE